MFIEFQLRESCLFSLIEVIDNSAFLADRHSSSEELVGAVGGSDLHFELEPFPLYVLGIVVMLVISVVGVVALLSRWQNTVAFPSKHKGECALSLHYEVNWS